MRYFSTFSGIGGFELGIQLAYEIIRDSDVSKERGGQETQTVDDANGQRLHPVSDETAVSATNGDNEYFNRSFDQGQPHCVGYSEIDKYASSIYQSRFPTHKNYGDITKIDETTLPEFDLLVGGFPCQSFSIAGKRRGFEDTRGTMFFELARILRAKQPRLFVFENVKGLLSHDNGNTFRTIVSALDELGYDCQWQVLNSKNHGVPQNRERVFIIGHLRGTPRPQVFPFSGGNNEVGQKYVGSIGTPRLPEQMHLSRAHKQPARVYDPSGISPTLSSGETQGRYNIVRIPEATKQGYAVATVGQSINLAVPNSKTRRGRVSNVAQTLDTGMQQHTLTTDARIRRLTPVECERLQGFPDNWTASVSDTQRYKTLGNAVTVNVIRDVFSLLLL